MVNGETSPGVIIFESVTIYQVLIDLKVLLKFLST